VTDQPPPPSAPSSYEDMHRRQLRSIAVAALIPRLSIVMGAGSGGGAGGDAGQLTRSPGSSSASLPYVVTVDSALALAPVAQPLWVLWVSRHPKNSSWGNEGV